MRMYDKLLGNCLAFSPNGKFLGVGFSNGALKVRSTHMFSHLPPRQIALPHLIPPFPRRSSQA